MHLTGSRREQNQVKGALFEVVVRRLLDKAGYVQIRRDNKSIRRSDGKIRGRGCWHDIDAYGKFSYPVPYVYPIRLLAEAKCYKGPVRLPVVQNFMGALKDISENYFISDKIIREGIRSFNRYTDCGAVFSASDFTVDAQRFALAHGIWMISYENNPLLKRTVDSMYELMSSIDISYASRRKSDLSRYLYEKLSRGRPQRRLWNRFISVGARDDFFEVFHSLYDSLSRIKTSAIATAIGEDPEIQYPIHLLSYESFPEEVFGGTDTSLFRVHYSVSETGLVFRVNPSDTDAEFLFSLPRNVYQEYFFQGRMFSFKEKFLHSIELPIMIRGLRRILRLELDTQWIGEQRELSHPRTLS